VAVNHILINVAPGETRVAYLDDGRLEEFHAIRAGAESVAGNIYLGRVEGVVGNLGAAFVEIGLERSGFLALPEVRPPDSDNDNDEIGDFLNEGDAVLVQVLRDPIEDKGAKLTTRISLTGRDLIYQPGQPGVAISRRISDPGERDRLMDLVQGLAAEGDGFILRTAAAEAEPEDLKREVERLHARWDGIEQGRGQARAPARLYREAEPVFALLRDHGGGGLDAITVDDANLLSALRAFATEEMPDIGNLLEPHDGRDDLFDAFDVEDQIDEAFDPEVPLPSGGSLIISEMPALTAIDVNTGGGSGRHRVEINRDAADEIGRQIRLRNLSGLLIIDFVSMKRDEDRDSVLVRLRRALDDDPLRPHVIGFTRLGLVEMTRRRRGPSLGEVLGEAEPPIRSAHTIALEALRQVLREAAAAPAAGFVLQTAPSVVEALEDVAAPARRDTESRLGSKIVLEPDSSCGPEEYDVRPQDKASSDDG